MVYAQRRLRGGDTWLKRRTAAAFYRVMRHLGEVPLPPDVGDFRLMSRRGVVAVQQLREHHRFMKGLFAWVGFPSIAIIYDHEPRGAGTTKWSFWKLWNLAIEGIIGEYLGRVFYETKHRPLYLVERYTPCQTVILPAEPGL